MTNPYRKGTKNFKVFGALMGVKKPQPPSQIARRLRIPVARVEQVLAALRNPMHNSVGRRAGVSVERKGDGYLVKVVKPDPKAKRPRPGSKTRGAKKQRKMRGR